MPPYSPPAGNGVNFAFAGSGSTPPAGNVVNFAFATPAIDTTASQSRVFRVRRQPWK